ncbi:MAG: hypothetical protein IKJ27_00275 [Clostridia bacterium]|nr:hypothetical protein [Clostridia bacterium]
MKNYLTYPCKIMRITQNYTGTTSHLPYSTGKPKDYPWDEGCTDTGRDYCYCPCDEMKVKRIYGVGSGGTNTIWLESTSEVLFADGTEDFCTVLIIHPNDADLKKIKEGQLFKRGEAICREGRDGCSSYHFHFSAGKGKYSGNGWKKNDNGKYVLTTTKGTYKPEKLFFVDTAFTKVVNTKGIKFKELPEEKQKYAPGIYKVTKALLLHVRSGPGTKYAKKKYSELTADAQKKIKKRAKYKANGYVMGLTFSVYETDGDWGLTPSGWVHLGYCTQQS